NTHGGVVANGKIERTVTVNRVALRQIGGENGEKLRRYVLGLALVAATAPQDGFLRQGCPLVPDADAPADWQAVDRRGRRTVVALDDAAALAYAEAAAGAYGVGPDRRVSFDRSKAKADA